MHRSLCTRSIQKWQRTHFTYTSIKKSNEGDIGMANCTSGTRGCIPHPYIFVQLLRAETRYFHSRCEIGEEQSLGNDAHLLPSWISGFIPRGSNSNHTVTMLRLLTSTLCYTRSHKPHTTSLNFYNTRARGRSRRGTLSKMASFIAETRDFHWRCGGKRSLGDDAHLWPS